MGDRVRVVLREFGWRVGATGGQLPLIGGMIFLGAPRLKRFLCGSQVRLPEDDMHCLQDAYQSFAGNGELGSPLVGSALFSKDP